MTTTTQISAKNLYFFSEQKDKIQRSAFRNAMQSNPIDKEYLAKLTKATSLESLEVAQIHFGDAGLRALLTNLAEVPNTIRDLNVCANSINLIDAELVELLDRAEIENFDVSQNNLHSRDAYALSKSSTLKKIVADENRIGDTGAKGLARNSVRLEELSLSSNIIGDSGGIALAQNRNIKKLSLCTNCLRDKAINALLESFEWGQLEDLNLQNQHVRITLSNEEVDRVEALRSTARPWLYNDMDRNSERDLEQALAEAHGVNEYYNFNPQYSYSSYRYEARCELKAPHLLKERTLELGLQKSLAQLSGLPQRLVNRIVEHL